jgi:hypothetical protein
MRDKIRKPNSPQIMLLTQNSNQNKKLDKSLGAIQKIGNDKTGHNLPKKE